MKTPVIDSLGRITVLGNAGSTHELAEIAGYSKYKSDSVLHDLEQILAPLRLDETIFAQIVDQGTAIFVDGETYGFRRGCRVGARLTAEILGLPEAPETRCGI